MKAALTLKFKLQEVHQTRHAVSARRRRPARTSCRTRVSCKCGEMMRHATGDKDAVESFVNSVDNSWMHHHHHHH